MNSGAMGAVAAVMAMKRHRLDSARQNRDRLRQEVIDWLDSPRSWREAGNEQISLRSRSTADAPMWDEYQKAEDDVKQLEEGL